MRCQNVTKGRRLLRAGVLEWLGREWHAMHWHPSPQDTLSRCRGCSAACWHHQHLCVPMAAPAWGRMNRGSDTVTFCQIQAHQNRAGGDQQTTGSQSEPLPWYVTNSSFGNQIHLFSWKVSGQVGIPGFTTWFLWLSGRSNTYFSTEVRICLTRSKSIGPSVNNAASRARWHGQKGISLDCKRHGQGLTTPAAVSSPPHLLPSPAARVPVPAVVYITTAPSCWVPPGLCFQLDRPVQGPRELSPGQRTLHLCERAWGRLVGSCIGKYGYRRDTNTALEGDVRNGCLYSDLFL